jgi:Fe-S-cluster containining protein
VDVHFNCTQCGYCCRNIKIPLTAVEAVDWLKDGNQVQIICEATPWSEEPSVEDQKAAHVKRRSFAATSGSMPVRVVAILVANLVGECPNLLPDMRCGIYERRPLVCRIYPAEVNPFIRLEPSKKACPTEAWAAHHPLLIRDGVLMNDVVRADIQRSRDTDALETNLKRRLCAALQIGDAALAQEGFVVHSPTLATLSSALSLAMESSDVTATPTQWRFVTNRSETVRDLAHLGAIAAHWRSSGDARYQYLGFKSESPAHGNEVKNA